MTKADQKGFSVIEALLILVVVGILGFTGWFVYHAQKTANKDLSSNNSTDPTYKKAQSALYKDWKSASLKYEKISFKYPSTWQISNTSKNEVGTGGTATPGADTAVVTSPTGLQVTLQTGEAGFNSSGLLVGLPTAKPINTLGGSYYLVYYTNKSQSTTEARGACVNKTSTSSENMPSVASKNIQVAGMSDGSTGPTANLICIGYPAPDSTSPVPVKPISAFEQDTSYNDAKLIIESLTY
jgi:cytoskeletal protein RodZ